MLGAVVRLVSLPCVQDKLKGGKKELPEPLEIGAIKSDGAVSLNVSNWTEVLMTCPPVLGGTAPKRLSNSTHW